MRKMAPISDRRTADRMGQMHRKPTHAWWAGLWLSLVGLLPGAEPADVVPAQARLSDRSVWVLDSRGQVDVLRERARTPAQPSQQLIPFDRVQTSTNSHANLLWYGRAHFQLSELTEISVPPVPEDRARGFLEVLKGYLYFFHRGPPREVEIRGPTSVSIVLGTEFSLRVASGGRTELWLFDGSVEVVNPQGSARAQSGERVVVDPGRAPVVTPMVEGIHELIQWFLYYPGVLNPDEAGLNPAEKQILAASLAAYRSGDLRSAVALYPPGRSPASDAERVYAAAVLLAVGQVDKADTLLGSIESRGNASTLAASLRDLVATVKGRPQRTAESTDLSTVALVESYRLQAERNLPGALAAARLATELAPDFGFAWARRSELEFSFGRIDSAWAALRRSSALAPKNAQAIALEGFLLSARNRIPDAIASFDRALLLDGGLGNAWLGRGLCRIRRGAAQAGRQDLLIAAAVEPRRSLLRSYLGKALAEAGEPERARHEMELARELDPGDPTAPFYAALLSGQSLRYNDAVRELEQARALDRNRAVFRSALLLDQDRAVRGANLAQLYHRAGLDDVAIREATRAVNLDYANYSAHLFLADAYEQRRDPRQVNLRYETAALSEYWLANLLAPVGAGSLSPTVTQQEYSKLFERDRLGLVSASEYRSSGAWQQTAAHYGQLGNLSYLLDATAGSDPGQRRNNDRDWRQVGLQLKHQFTARDTVVLQPLVYDARGGDLTQYYDPRRASAGFRFRESQSPQLVAGLHHDWAPGQHTLLLGGRLQDTLKIDNPEEELRVLNRQAGQVDYTALTFAPEDYRNRVTDLFAELQHLWQAGPNTLVAGARVHRGGFTTRMSSGDSPTFFVAAVPIAIVVTGETARAETDLHRAGTYLYDHVNLGDTLRLTGGVAYDWVRAPENWRSAPISGGQGTVSQLSPKAGVTWHPVRNTTARLGFMRSLGGVSIDQSYRLEPTQVAGFNQAFRSLIPESVAGNVPVPSLQTLGAAVEQQWSHGLSLGVEGTAHESDARQRIGVYELTYLSPFPNYSLTAATTRRRVQFAERSLAVTLNQLVGTEWSFGARYQLSQADWRMRYPGLPANQAIPPRIAEAALLHHLDLFAIYNHPSGYFGRAESHWFAQNNQNDAAILADDAFWQVDVFAGRRLPWGRAELQLGLLNLTGQDYRLNPLNLQSELPRRRTFTVTLLLRF